jgi:hypothetical protein
VERLERETGDESRKLSPFSVFALASMSIPSRPHPRMTSPEWPVTRPRGFLRALSEVAKNDRVWVEETID